MGLSPGDLVNVVRTVDPADPITEDTDQGDTSDDGADATTGTGDVVIARGATVVSAEELTSDRLLVSILAPEGDAVAVAARAESGSLRLVQVSP
jgi:lipopolysaccharide export system protein LptA